MAIEVIKVNSDQLLQEAFSIRKIVFVEEQKVPIEEELDEYENESIHFLAYLDNKPCGASRYRQTADGVKLERFAVLKEARGKQVGSALVQAVLDDIASNTTLNKRLLYLNAQLDAIPLYKKFGFRTVGDMFLECDIKHLKMIKES